MKTKMISLFSFLVCLLVLSSSVFLNSALAADCRQWTATNDEHVAEARAYFVAGGCDPDAYYATGSDDYLGSSGSTTTTLHTTDDSVYYAGSCPSETGEVTVAADGSGDYTSVQDAIDAAPGNGGTWHTINIKSGTYHEVVTVPSDKTYIELVGEDAETTVITYNNYASLVGSTWGSATAFFEADDFIARNITFENSFDYDNSYAVNKQAVAAEPMADRQIFVNCRFTGYQDTLYVRSGRSYFLDCFIQGHTDFIFGAGTAVFKACEINSRPKNGGCISAPSTYRSTAYGIIFIDCNVTGTSTGVWLGRPWHPSSTTSIWSNAVYLNCYLGSHIAQDGWTSMSGVYPDTERMYEYNNQGPGAVINSSRPQLSDSEAANYTVSNILSGSDNWDAETLAGENPEPVINDTFNGTYSIIALHSGKAIDTWEWGTVDGTNIAQYNYWAGEAQQFIISQVDGIWHRITPVIAEDQAIDVTNCSLEDGANIQTWSYLANNCQQFRFQREDDGVWRIINRNSAMCLAVLDGSTDDGANVVQSAPVSGATYQMFKLVEVSIPEECEDWTATNDDHVSAGRAYTVETPDGCNTITTYYAVGSDEELGASGSTITTIYSEDGENYHIGSCDGTVVEEGDIVLSPGDDLQAAVDSIEPGHTIWLNSGTYNMSGTIRINEGNDGTASAMKTISALDGAAPVLDWNATSDTSSARGIVLDGAYWHVYGITIREAGDNGMLLSGDNNIIERCVFTANRDTGLQLSRYNNYSDISQWPTNNLILQCESYDNRDSDGEDADGFAAKLTCGEGNVFRGCYAHNNIDDGWDLYTYSSYGPIGKVTIEYCIAYQNGTLTNGTVSYNGDRNGFKLGGENVSVNHTVRYCIAAKNGKTGFTYNRNLGYINFYNNTAYDNASSNFYFAGGNTIFLNNVSLSGGSNDNINGSSLNWDYNAWWYNGSAVSGNGVTVTSSDFQSLSTGTLTWVEDDSVNLGSFLIPKSGSDLIGTGSGGVNMGAR